MGYARIVGRVGALAVALGVGVALPVEALAESADGNASGANSRSTGGDPGQQSSTSSSTDDAAAAADEPADEAQSTQSNSAAAQDNPETDAGLDTAPDAAEEPDVEADADAEADAEADADVETDAHTPAGADDTADADTAPEAEGTAEATSEVAAVADTETDAAESGSEIPAVQVRTSRENEQEAATPALPSRSPAPDVGGDIDEVDLPAVASLANSTTEAEPGDARSGITTVADITTTREPAPPPATSPVTTAVPQRTGLFSGFLSLLGLEQSGKESDAPAPPATPAGIFAAALQKIRRDIERLFDNKNPAVAPTLNSLSDPEFVTGSMNAVDPEGDPITYKVASAPARGTVAIDTNGDFTYTAGADLAAKGGTDEFAVAVRDIGFRLNFWTPRTTTVPVTVTVAASSPTTATPASRVTPMAMATAMPDNHQHPAADSEYVDLATFGMTNGSSHTGHDGLVNGRTAITTEAVEAYNNLRHFVGLEAATIDEVGAWAFANGLTNNSQAWGTDQQGVGLWYSMQGAKVGWMADETFDPQVVADIERTARLGSEEDVMTMVAEYGHEGFADYLSDNGFDRAFINTLKMEPHYAGWMHDRAHGRLSIEGVATAHDVNHLTVLSHDQMRPFMNDTFDYPQWPALDVSHERVLEYFQSMVVLGDPLGHHLNDLNGPPEAPGVPGVSIGDAVGAEGDSGSSDLGFTVSLSEASSDTVTVGYTTTDGTATAGEDYTADSGTVTFAPGVTAQQLNIGVLGDTTVESNETFTVTLSNPTGATLAAGTAIGTITNDDAATPAPGVSSVVHTVSDDWGSGHVANITLTAGSAGINGWTLEFDAPIEITNAWNAEIVSSADGHHVLRNAAWNGVLADGQSANPGYQATPGGAAATATNFTLNGVAVGTPGPTPSLPSVSIGDAVGAEGDSGSSDLGFTVSLSEASSTAVSVGYTTTDGTATAGEDYTADSGTVTFAPGVTAQQLNIGVLGDTTVESNETFTVTLSNPTGATLAAGTAIGTITNDDIAAPPPPGVSIGDAVGAEGDSGSSDLGFTVSLSEASSDTVTVGYTTTDGTATAGEDYTADSGTVTFAPGVTAQQLNIGVLGDTTVESNETFTVALSNPTGATLAAGTAIGTITNDDAATPAPGVSSVVHTVSDDWGSGHVANITLTAGSAGINGWTLEFDAPIEITNAWNAEIVSSADGHHVLRNAAWNGVLADGQSANPGYQATPGGAAATATNFTLNGVAVGTPGPTPSLPSVSIGDAVGAEGDSGSSDLGFTVSLSEASSTAVTVGYTTTDGTATAGEDYTADSGTVTFAPGETAQQLNIGVLGDTTVESNETFTVALSNPTGATLAAGTAIGTITNDDIAAPPPPSTLSISDASVAENTPGEGGIAPGYLSTSGNQIIDSQGNTVKLAGVNWFGGETPNGVPHGLWTRNYQDMIDQMAAEGFNTIRLPYSNEMLHSTEAPTGIDYFQNPELQGMSRLQVMDEVIRYAGEKDMRVILDQHRNSAGAGPNGNGLWFDGQYTEDSWVADWQFLAQRYLGNSTVIGADLSNEPHNGTWGGGGATDWARAAERAGNAVLAVNPELLIIVEGIETYQGQNYWWGGNLMGVRDRPIVLNVPNQLVYSPHAYPNSVFPQPWFEHDGFAADLPDKYEQMWGYIYEENIAPIMIGEFGTKLEDPKDEPWFEAMTSYLSGDFDNDGTIDIPAGVEGISWTYWSWNPNSGDTGGILADDWNTVHDNKMVYLEPIQYETDGGGNAVARFTITLASASTQPVTVQYSTSNGTATAGTDYVSTTGAITFAPGVTSQTVEVQVLADTLVEPDESFSVTLSNPTGATISDGVGAGTIIDGGVV